MEAHVYNTALSAWMALAQVNADQNIPISQTAETQTYCNVERLDESTWYIQADDVTKVVLGTENVQEIELPNAGI